MDRFNYANHHDLQQHADAGPSSTDIVRHSKKGKESSFASSSSAYDASNNQGYAGETYAQHAQRPDAPLTPMYAPLTYAQHPGGYAQEGYAGSSQGYPNQEAGSSQDQHADPEKAYQALLKRANATYKQAAKKGSRALAEFKEEQPELYELRKEYNTKKHVDAKTTQEGAAKKIKADKKYHDTRRFKAVYVNERVLVPGEKKFSKDTTTAILLQHTNQRRAELGKTPLVEESKSRNSFERQLTGKALKHASKKRLVKREEWGTTYGISDSEPEA
jgi:hypothetical protein